MEIDKKQVTGVVYDTEQDEDRLIVRIGVLSTMFSIGYTVELWAQGDTIRMVHAYMQYVRPTASQIVFGHKPKELTFTYDAITNEIMDVDL